MKHSKKIYILLMLVFAFTIVYANSKIVSSFTADSNTESVTVKWTSISENNIKSYIVERSVNNNQTFRNISTIQAKGYASDYIYKDQNVYKHSSKELPELQNQNEYYYRLKIVTNDNKTTYTEQVRIIPKTSTVKKTWGMLKEMMR